MAAVAPEGAVLDFVTKRLVANGAVEGPSPVLSQRIEWAARWAKALDLRSVLSPKSKSPPVDAKTASALRAFAASVVTAHTAEEAQAAAFASIKEAGGEPSKFFAAVYQILVGADKGPRLGPYVMDAGTDRVSKRITEALTSGRP